MAPDPDSPRAADKGKGKAVEKPEDAKTDKDGKPLLNGKEDEKIIDCSCVPATP